MQVLLLIGICCVVALCFAAGVVLAYRLPPPETDRPLRKPEPQEEPYP